MQSNAKAKQRERKNSTYRIALESIREEEEENNIII